MALFSSGKHTVFQPSGYGTRRRRGFPRWLVLIFTGIVLGAGGLLFVQKSYGPPRLTAEQSNQLHQDLNSANIDKQRLQSQLSQQTNELEKTEATVQDQESRLIEAQQQLKAVQSDLQMLLEDIPPDPRGTSPGIRSAHFSSEPGTLNYHFLVMQDEPLKATFRGTVSLVVEGRYPNGRTNTIDLEPFDFSVDRYKYAQGSVALPDNMTATLVTIRIRPSNSTQIAATRTIRVR